MKISKVVFNRIGLAALIGLGVCNWTAQAQSSQPGTAAGNKATVNGGQDNTGNLIRQVARHNDMTVALAEVGSRKAQNSQLKQYCLQLQHDQIQVNDQLKPVAGEQGVSIDQSLTKKDLKELSRLEKDTGNKLDRTLAKRLLQEQAKGLSLLESAGSRNSTGDLQQYAQQALPKLRQEFSQTQALARDVGVKSRTISGRAPQAAGGAGQVQ